MKVAILLILLLLCIFTCFLLWAAMPGVYAVLFEAQAILNYRNGVPPAHEGALRVATYNIGYASGDLNNKGRVVPEQKMRDHLDAMVARLKEIQPDVVALQEVDFASRRSHDINQMEYLARGLGFAHAAYVINWNRRYVAWPFWPPSKHFGRIVSGQVVLSRYPIREQTVHVFNKPGENPWWYNLFYLDRMAQHVVIEADGRQMDIWNVHLEAFDQGARIRQAQRLTDLVREHAGAAPCVLGDFNSRPDQEAYQFFAGESGLRVAGDPAALTHPSWKPADRIDHIFCAPATRVSASGVVTNLPASDHLPVWAELRF